jgi:hypothetical protein
MNSGDFLCGGAWEASALPLSYTREACILRGFAHDWQTCRVAAVMESDMAACSEV